MPSMHEKVAVVTGAMRGVGLGIAKEMHDAGATVMITDLDRAGLDDARGGSDRWMDRRSTTPKVTGSNPVGRAPVCGESRAKWGIARTSAPLVEDAFPWRRPR